MTNGYGLRTIQLTSSLCEAAEKKFGTQFGGLEPFLNFILQELISDDANGADQRERLMVEQRLKDLGYI